MALQFCFFWGGGVGENPKNYVWIIFDFLKITHFNFDFILDVGKRSSEDFWPFRRQSFHCVYFTSTALKAHSELNAAPNYRVHNSAHLVRYRPHPNWPGIKFFISCHFSHFHDCQQFKTPIGSFPSGPHHLSIFFKCSLSFSSVTCHRLWHIPNFFFFSCPQSSPAPLLFIFTQTLTKSTTSAVSKDWMCLQLTFSNHNRLYFHRLEKDVTNHDWGCSSKSFSRGMFAQKYQRSGVDGCYST